MRDLLKISNVKFPKNFQVVCDVCKMQMLDNIDDIRIDGVLSIEHDYNTYLMLHCQNCGNKEIIWQYSD